VYANAAALRFQPELKTKSRRDAPNELCGGSKSGIMKLIVPARIFSLHLCLLLAFPLLVCAWPASAQEGPLRDLPPKGIPVEELVRRFATKEKEFKLARENYTWTQSVTIETLEGNRVDGVYHQVYDVLFDGQGKRIEHVTYAPQSTLTRIEITEQDLNDIDKRMPFTMTIDDLPYYNVTYLGQQQEDELNCYVFDLSPKRIEKGHRYFEGRIWVDDHDFQIVKTYGKNVPDIIQRKKDEENLFPRFTTWRQQIDGKYWFPTYTYVDDTLHFMMGDVHIRQVVKYENYKRFGSRIKIFYQGKEVPGVGNAPQNNLKQEEK
jgi:hypothetical protein